MDKKDERDFTLVQDEDCHWYVIPFANLYQFIDWINDIEDPVPPEWAVSVNGAPSRVKFKSFEIK